MQTINGNLKGKRFRVWANYGTTMSPDQYIRVRNFPPVIEQMSVPESESRLKKESIDNMTRITPSTEETSSAAAEGEGSY
jgi:hypothetical protein